jgi:hypothetical protein
MAMCRDRHGGDVVTPFEIFTLVGHRKMEGNMWSFADRVVKAVSDVTVGTVIVLVHVALADRKRKPVHPRRLPS